MRSVAHQRFVLPLVPLAILALAATARAADDVVVEEQPPVPAPAPMPMVIPRIQVQMQQLQVPGIAGAVRREPCLGIVTGPVAAPLRAQLDLPEGVGLVVEAVAEDGAAARGGLRKFDVLRKFDDQIVCTSEQLTTLVRAAGKGKKVALGVTRGGREAVVEVVIDERDVPVQPPFAAAGGGQFGGLPGMPLDLEAILDGAIPEGLPGLGADVRAQVQRQVQEALAQAQAGDGPGGNAQARVLQIFPGGVQRVVVVADGAGSVEIREQDLQRTVTIKDADGTEVYSGPLDTDADRAAIPEEFRERVGKVEAQLDGGRAPAPAPAAEADPDDEI